MIDEYRDLVLETEIQILNHALVGMYEAKEVVAYKFQFAELKTLLEEIVDIHTNNFEPVIQALLDKYPIVYGRLRVCPHSNLKMLLAVAKKGKARIYVFNQLTVHLGRVSDDGKPLEVILDKIIADMRMIKGVL